MSRPALVLIPGLMCDQGIWSAQCRALSAHGFDYRIAEHGLADSLADMASALLYSNPGPLAVVGHSMGGRVAFEVARQAGSRLCGVALLDTGFRSLASGAAGEREVAGRMRLLEQARAEGVRAMAAAWVQGMLHPDRLADQALLEDILAMFARRSPAHFAAQLKALIERPDAGEVLKSIRVPTLLLCGAQDQWSSPAQHGEMAQLIAGSVLTCVPDCGHMSPMERPEAVNEALLSWLAGIDAFRT